MNTTTKTPTNYSKIKTQVWAEFSRYKRVQDCLRTTGLPFVGICFTCEKQFHISALQAGHLNSGRRNTVLLSERGVHDQCTHCNFAMNGRHKEYRVKAVKIYGEKKVLSMERLAKMTIPDRDINWEARLERYKRKYTKTMRQYGYRTFGELLRMGI